MPKHLSTVRRVVSRSAVRPRRAIVWADLRRRAKNEGFSKSDLSRFYDYFSDHLNLRTSQFVDPLQQPSSFFPGLRSQPIYNASEFSWTRTILAGYEEMKEELLAASAASDLDDQPQNLTDRGRWTVLHFHLGGQRVEATHRACPRTSSIIDQTPGAGNAGQTLLSVLRGGTHINRHFGPTNVRLRCHVGLVVPDGARIRIADETHTWREGECLIFDDSFDHEVWNDSDRERVVLIVDFWHPDLTPAETWAISEARRHRLGLRDIRRA